jgi:hypothetical protein
MEDLIPMNEESKEEKNLKKNKTNLGRVSERIPEEEAQERSNERDPPKHKKGGSLRI